MKYATNEFLKEPMQASGHAKERWRERFGDGDMYAAMAKGLPFGMQRADSLLLLHEEAVFVTKRTGRVRLVITVLTKSYAVANMQVLGCKIDIPIEKPRIAHRGVPDRVLAENLVAMLPALAGTDTEQLKETQESIARLKQSLPNAGNGSLKRDLTLLANLIPRELSQRTKVEKYKAEALSRSRHISAMKRAISEFISGGLTDELYLKIMRRSSQILERVGDKVGEKGWFALLEIADAEAAADAELTTELQSAQ